jgi:pyruvate formate lyase activating enzyme
MLKQIIEEKLVDYIAMDIKAPLDKYEKVAKINGDIDNIQRTINLIRESGVEYEFRTTVVKDFLEKEDLIKVGEWLKGSDKLFLQQFNSKVPLIDKTLEGKETYTINELEQFKKMLEPYFKKVGVR